MDINFEEQLHKINLESLNIKEIEEETMEIRLREKLFEVEFEPLSSEKIEHFEDKSPILNAKLDISVSMGSCKKSIKDVLNLKNGDIIYINKTVDEELEININNKIVAIGESIKVDKKISVRILDFKNKLD